MTKRLATLAALLLVALVATELSLRGAGAIWRLLQGRTGDLSTGAGAFRIVCIGDSNTYGIGTPRDQTYPAQLERVLNQRSAGRRFEVVNLGVPGTNSGQALHRLRGYIEAYRPDLLVVVIGVNDYWNPAEMDLSETASLGERLHRAASYLRTYRLVMLTLDQLGQQASGNADGQIDLNALQVRGQARTQRDRVTPDEAGDDAGPQAGPGAGGDVNDATVWQLRDGGFTTVFRNPARSVLLSPEEHEQVLRRNLEEIMRVAAAEGVPLVLATYAANIGHYQVANRAMNAVVGAQVVSQIFDRALRARLPDASAAIRELFFPDLHPKAPVYTVYAANLSDELTRRGLVPKGP